MISASCTHTMRSALLPRVKYTSRMSLPFTRGLQTWHGSRRRPVIISRFTRSRRLTPNSHHFSHHSSSNAYQKYRGSMRVIWAVIGLNVVTYLAWSNPSSQGNRHRIRLMTDHMTLSWRNLQAGRYHTVVTSTFSHYSASHLFLNMFGLWTFGGIMARSGVGALATLSLLIGSGLTGSFMWLYEHRDEKAVTQSYLWNLQNSNMNSSALGASGVLMGSVAAATCLAPRAPMALLGVIPMPLYVATAGFVAMDLYYLDKASTVGHSAHLGGTMFGTLFYFAFLPRLGGVSSLLARWRL